MQKTNNMTMSLFKGMKEFNDKIFDVSTGGFLRPTAEPTEKKNEEEKKQGKANPVMT